MHTIIGLDISMKHAVVNSCKGETRTSEHIGISPAEELGSLRRLDGCYQH
jgi:hypothetical protein